jgi:hypothetical protein
MQGLELARPGRLLDAGGILELANKAYLSVSNDSGKISRGLRGGVFRALTIWNDGADFFQAYGRTKQSPA